MVFALTGCRGAPIETTAAFAEGDATVETTAAAVETTAPVATEEMTEGSDEVAATTEAATVLPETTVPPTTESETTQPYHGDETAPVETSHPEAEPPETTPSKETEPPVTEPPVTTPPATETPVHTHSYSATVKEPTCEDGGFTSYKCECGDAYEGDKTDPIGHNYGDEVVAPTETEQGYTLHTCSHCGDSYKDSYTDPVPPETTTPAEVEISRSDVEAAILKYINLYRGSSLTRLSGMSKVARYRSNQLVYNFNHDTTASKEAHAHYQYGEYIDMTVHGLPETENYYTSKTREAIAYRGQAWDVTTADEMGRQIAEQIRDSAGHWNYIGSSEYAYCGIGCTKSGDIWYCCILVGNVNYG